MKSLSILLLTLAAAPSATVASEAEAVSEPLTTESMSLSVSDPGGPFHSITSVNPGGPVQTFTSTSVSATGTDTSSLGSESTTSTALHPSEPTGVSGGTGTGTGASASASATTTSSEGSAFGESGSSKVALVVALGAGLLGCIAF